jgi:hypothetical protein
MTGERLVENTSSCRNNQIALLFYRIKQNPAITLDQPQQMAAHMSDWGDSSNQRRRGGKRHTLMMFVGGGVGDRRNSRTIPTVENLRGGSFSFPPEPL